MKLMNVGDCLDLRYSKVVPRMIRGVSRKVYLQRRGRNSQSEGERE